ncbi:peptidoglycan-binding protein [Candidatus Nomurabacteria bacterium]|nr:peptidoglycan-binding protein [Candidatus Nomurabacteria bacterium]
MLTTTLKLGSKGEEVKCLQTKLNTLADGKFGKKTKQAVIVLQKNHALKADGIVGPATRKVLNGN